jgi:hypothetical protein
MHNAETAEAGFSGAHTQPCERALSSDKGLVAPAVTAGSSAYFALVTALAARTLQREGLLATLNLKGLPELLALATRSLTLLATGTDPGGGVSFSPSSAAGLLSRKQALLILRAGGAVLLVLLSYCPLGRLAFARPLRRRAVALTQRLLDQRQATLGLRLTPMFKALLATARSPQGVLAIVNVLLLPLLARGLRTASVSGSPSGPGGRAVAAAARTGGILVTGLRVALTVCSGVAAYTLLRPQHLIPTNPWLPEPAAAAGGVAEGEVALRPDGKSGRVGVLLCNLGTTASPKPGDVRRFLRPFLSDPRVVEVRLYGRAYANDLGE